MVEREFASIPMTFVFVEELRASNVVVLVT